MNTEIKVNNRKDLINFVKLKGLILVLSGLFRRDSQ